MPRGRQFVWMKEPKSQVRVGRKGFFWPNIPRCANCASIGNGRIFHIGFRCISCAINSGSSILFRPSAPIAPGSRVTRIARMRRWCTSVLPMPRHLCSFPGAGFAARPARRRARRGKWWSLQLRRKSLKWRHVVFRSAYTAGSARSSRLADISVLRHTKKL